MFLEPELTTGTQDVYHIRNAVLQALTAQLPRFKGILLDVGCGFQPYRELVTAPPSRVERYIGMDLADGQPDYRSARPDLLWDGLSIPLDTASVDTVMATEVLEHCPQPMEVLREIHRVLCPGGLLFFTVPFLWPLHNVPYDEYRYTPFALERMVREAGFMECQVRPHGGWDASLAQTLGLWAMRRPMPEGKRRIMKRITLPIVRYLLKHDHVPALASAPLITGLSGTAIKP